MDSLDYSSFANYWSAGTIKLNQSVTAINGLLGWYKANSLRGVDDAQPITVWPNSVGQAAAAITTCGTFIYRSRHEALKNMPGIEFF